MTAPNLLNFSNAIFETQTSTTLTTTEKVVLFNESTSNKIIRLKRITVSNIDGTNSADVTVKLRRQNVDYAIASTIAVEADSKLDLLSKESSIYLEEEDAIVAVASATGDLEITCAYEIFSDNGNLLVTRGLQLYYDAADDNSYPNTGTIWKDLTSNGYNGTLTDVTYLSSNNGVLDFDITSTAVCDTQADILDLGANDFTWEIWLNVDSHSTNNQTIIEKGVTSGDRGYGLYVDAFNDQDRPTFRYSFNGVDWIYFGLWPNPDPMIVGDWYHITLTRTGGTLRGYKNGVFGSQRGDLSTNAIYNSTEFLQFGATNNYDWLDGKIGAIRFYNRALSDTEILQNFNAHKSRYGL